MKYSYMRISGVLLTVLFIAGCTPAVNDRTTAQTDGEVRSQQDFILSDLFPSSTDENSFCEGMIDSSSLWKAEREMPVYATGDNGPQIQTEPVSHIEKGQKFRVFDLATWPVGEAGTSVLYALLADGSGWTVMSDGKDGLNLTASLLKSAKWPEKFPVQLVSGTKMYDKPGGKILKTSPEQLLASAVTKGPDDSVWGQTDAGWFPFLTDGKLNWYTPIGGIVSGPVRPKNTLESLYRQILVNLSFANSSGSLNWGYTLQDLTHDTIPELLVIGGGLNKDLTVSVYGASEKALDLQPDGSFSCAWSNLYADPEQGLLRFYHDRNRKTIYQLNLDNNSFRETELSQKETDTLDDWELKPLSFVSINDFDSIESLVSITLGEIYPDSDFDSATSSDGSSTSKKLENSSASADSGMSNVDWALNYDMVVREKPDRKSVKLYTLPEATVIQVTDIWTNEQETWGKLQEGGWICLKDADYVYAFNTDTPVAPDTKYADDWNKSYRQTVQTIASDSKYDTCRDYYPSWYLWEDAGYKIPVLVVKTGISEADFKLEFFLAQKTGVQKLAETGAGHSTFSSDGQTGVFYRLMAHMGIEVVDKFTLSSGNLTSEKLSSRQDVLDYQNPIGEIWYFQNAAAFQ